MKKEVMVAVIFGVLLGLVVAVVMVLRVRQSTGQNSLAATNQITPKVTTKNSELQPLEITSPRDNAIVGQDSVTIKGKALKNSLLIIESSFKDLAVKNSKEEFSINFPLTIGENIISITAYPKDPKLNSQTSTLRIYYLTQ